MNKFTKLAAITMAILILFVVVYSVFFISSNVHHQCSDENCPICEQIHIAESTLLKFSIAMIMSALVLFVYPIIRISKTKLSTLIIRNNPILLKVKLLI